MIYQIKQIQGTKLQMIIPSVWSKYANCCSALKY